MTQPTETRLLVTGGRNFADRDLLYATLDRLHAEHHFMLVIHGDARGAGPILPGLLQWGRS